MVDRLAEWEGTVAPAWMRNKTVSRQVDMLNKLPLRVGRVVKVHLPSADSNRSKFFTEYDVLCEDGGENRPASRVTLNNCWMISEFGSAVDFTKSTPRDLKTDKQDTEDFGYDSWVLVMLVNGSSFAGVIVGGLQHTKGEADTDGDGHRHIRQFNGLRQEINKDGEFIVSFKGATKNNGDLLGDAAHAGTTLKIAKDGSYTIGTKDDDQHINVNHGSTKTIDILATNDLKIKSKGTCNWEAAGNWSYKVGGTTTVTTTGAVKWESSTGGMDFVANAGLIKTSSLGVHHGLATDFMIKGTTYRVAETTLHSTLIAGLSALAGQLGAAGGTLAGAGGVLQAVSLAHKVPVVGPIVGSIPLQAAAAAIMAAAGILSSTVASITTLITAISTFEAGTPTYLSLKNKLD